MNKKRFLVFQHLRIEHPDIFREFFKENDHIPYLNDFDVLWVMGESIDVWQENKYPRLIEEKLAIRKAVNELMLPYMGICLEHQLLTDALCGEVDHGDQLELASCKYIKQKPVN